ncbi:hypothetical protein EDD22DRAFT_950502 [Suillus occidentalis]|nr:hypothetical protein EDD22DRAFT_950502 [Suillus occidentalis]
MAILNSYLTHLFCSLWLLYTQSYTARPILRHFAMLKAVRGSSLHNTTIPPVLLTMAAVHGPILPPLPSFTIPPILLTMAAAHSPSYIAK